MRSFILIALFISYGGNAEVIRRFQAVPFVMGGTPITFDINTISVDDIASIKCVVRFSDGRDPIELQPTVTRGRVSAICRLPPEIQSGIFDIDLEIMTTSPKAEVQAEVLSEAVIINPSPLAEVKVEENWDARELLFTWDPEYFEQFFNPGATIMIQASLYVSDGFEPVFTPFVIGLLGFNVGTVRFSVSEAIMNRIATIHSPYFYVLNPVGSQSHMYLSSLLFAPTHGMTDTLAIQTCVAWMDSAQIPSPPEDIHPCPPCLCQVINDANFIKTEYNPQIVRLANGALDNHVLYYEHVPTGRGHAQSCSYNTLNNNLVLTSPAQAGFIHKVSKHNSYVDNFFADVWPYIVCCLQSNSQQVCDIFHELRPIDTGHEYPGPEEPCKGTGDPHFVTFESVKFDFMGNGEFWLIRGPGDNGFGVQGRMAPVFEGQKVSYFKAVAARDGNTTVQIQLDGKNFQILINGVEFAIPEASITLPLDGIAITIEKRLVHVRLQTGFTIIVENANDFFNVFGTGAHWNKGKGFMGIFGNFDDDVENDLTAQDGFVIPPTAANLRDLSLIHHRFGLTWMTTASESFFVYEEGRSWEYYANRDFGPILEYPDPATLPEEVREICGESLFCYYEYVGTDSLDKAADVERWEREFDDLREEIEREVPMCDVIASPANGRVQAEGHLNGSSATYSCDTEYDFLGGNRVRTCSASVEKSYWTGVEPTCIWTCTKCEESMDFKLSHDPNDCNKFFLCSFGERISLDCPAFNFFDPALQICTSDFECHGPPGC
ncbi:Protein mesh [Pseudolycoriella hygida]|uniref:Protein mesh n=1 Tax=Pseudolycoriella hygida TaxID=35572 RepID=A0A9Q0N654_9DIPT|nr:Protein mesh [Pseudolycoriella hygida]